MARRWNEAGLEEKAGEVNSLNEHGVGDNQACFGREDASLNS